MKLSAKLPHDDEGATLMRSENIRGQRYTEIFLIGGHAITHHLIGGIYNTIGMNDPAGTGVSCPQDVLDEIDVEDLKEKYDLLGAFKNGPRLWCLDWAEVMVGGEQDFSGTEPPRSPRTTWATPTTGLAAHTTTTSREARHDQRPAAGPTAPGICTPAATLAGGETRARGRTAWACRVDQAHARAGVRGAR